MDEKKLNSLIVGLLKMAGTGSYCMVRQMQGYGEFTSQSGYLCIHQG